MKTKTILRYLLALIMIVSVQSAFSQGVQIASGAKIEATGAATIDITDGHFVNSGTFTPGSGTVSFFGTTLQTITSGGCSFYNIVLNNQKTGNSDINVTDPLSITGSATFTNGIVCYSGTGSTTFGIAATSTNGHAGSFVDGQVSKDGTSVFTFPVGDVQSGNAIWAPLAIDAPSVSSTISAEYRFEAPDYHNDPDYFCNAGAFDYVSSNEYWTISTTGATPAVTLFWNDGARSGIQNLSDLRVASWEDCSGSKWVDRGGSTTGTTATGSITSTIPFASFSKVTFASQSGQNALPVYLLDFSAGCGDGGVYLEWVTASENNNQYFTIERSADLYEWALVAKVPGAGNSNSLIEYSFSDQQSSTGDVYYRLTQTDFNGESETFAPVMVRCGESLAEVSCYPNPFSDQLVVNLQNIGAEHGSILLRDVTGRTVLYVQLSSEDFSQQSVSLSLSGIATGVYSLEVRAGSFEKTMRIVKEK